MENPERSLPIHPTRSKSSGRLNSSGGCQAAAPSTPSVSPIHCRADPFHQSPTTHSRRSGRIYLFLLPLQRPNHGLQKDSRLPIYRCSFLCLIHWQTPRRVGARTQRVSNVSPRTLAAGVLRAIVSVRYRRSELHVRHEHRRANTRVARASSRLSQYICRVASRRSVTQKSSACWCRRWYPSDRMTRCYPGRREAGERTRYGDTAARFRSLEPFD